MDLSQAIKAEASRLGFALTGITPPDPPPHTSVYERWLKLGRHAQMDYLTEERARARRANPRLILPGCKSILVLAARYPDPASAEAFGRLNPAGRIAAYAWGTDYHLLLPERLEALVAFIETQINGPVANRWYTDTGPLLERDLAQRAGLGWIGKNTCLINSKIGSYFLLAEILLGFELEPDTPFEADRCGTCTRCLEACPTGALLPDHTMDSRLCISYLSIENKGRIPAELSPLMGDWVFGCDICQMACPWNRGILHEYDPGFKPRAGMTHPDLIAELALTSQEFNRKFKNNPVQRVRRRGYLRNVAVALGNSGNAMAIPALERAQQDIEPLVREHAALALAHLKKSL